MSANLTMDIAGVTELSAFGHRDREIQHVRVFDRDLRVDVYGSETCRATVLLFHGVGGMLGDGGLLRRFARALSSEGLRACVVHYFNATGTLIATHASVRENVGTWQKAIAEVARHYAAEGPRPVGLFGYSLGGYLAAAAATDTDAVGAVAVLAGGLFEVHDAGAPDHFPALLILHGDHDEKVSPDRAEALQRMAWHANGFVNTVMYPNEGHTFGASAERDAIERVSAFFRKRLGAGNLL